MRRALSTLRSARRGLGPVTTVSSVAAAETAVANAPPGSVVQMAAGTYDHITLTGSHAGNVTFQPVPGAHVNITGTDVGHSGYPSGITITGSHIVVRGFWIFGEVRVNPGSSFITIDHNDITGGAEGVYLSSADCTVPNAPTWPNCAADVEAKITDCVISGNRIHDIGGPTQFEADDAVNCNNYARVLISGNEVYGILDDVGHSDFFQTTFGGTDITFDQNYCHDTQAQGFFIKDGDVTNATITNNLWVRGRAEGQAQLSINIYNTANVVIRNNTNWSQNPDRLRNVNSVVSTNAAVDHNVEVGLEKTEPGDAVAYSLTESYNVFGTTPSSFTPAATSSVNASPTFVNTAIDDYRLATNPNGIGIDWRPSDRQYGPTA